MAFDVDIANFIVGLVFSSASCVIATLEFASNQREKKNEKEKERLLKHRVAHSQALLKAFEKYSSLQHELEEVLENDFDTVTLSNCDFKEMGIQCNRVINDLQKTVGTFKNAVSKFNKMVCEIINNESYLPESCVSVALSMEEVKNTLHIKINLFENHLSELMWKCILFKSEIEKYCNDNEKDDINQFEKTRMDLYNDTYKIYLEYIELCALIKIVFEKYRIILYGLNGYAETLKNI